MATPDLLLLHPDTWAAVRTQKDTLGRYIASGDPTDDQAETAWGVDVLQSTQFTPGEAVLVDSTLVGRVAERETLTFDPSCVKEVLIGPGLHMETRESSVRYYLDSLVHHLCVGDLGWVADASLSVCR